MTHKLIMYVHLNYLIATCASVTHFIKKNPLQRVYTLFSHKKYICRNPNSNTSNFHQCLQTEYSPNTFFNLFN